MSNEMHESNRNWWDTAGQAWTALDDPDWDKCHLEPSLAFEGNTLEMIRKYAGSLKGKEACVLASGNNWVAFALAGMRAAVTSIDISQKNLDLAAQRAEKLGLDITFIRCDVADLQPVTDNTFDLVCSSNGFFIWMSDLNRLFSGIQRILKPGGFYIEYDIHPFLRPWVDQLYKVEMEKSYYDTGPFRNDGDGWTTWSFHWTVSDIINAAINSKLNLRHIEETRAKDSRFWQGSSIGRGTDPTLLDWHVNPLAGLPTWLTLVLQKPDR